MTIRECAVVMAYTGVTMLAGDDLGEFYRYVEHLLGYPVMTHELASEALWEEIKRRSNDDFLALCRNRSDPRVLSLEEVTAWDGPLVVEERCCGGRLTWALYYGEYYPALRFQLPGCVLVLPTAVYGEDWRCWTAWPDDDARRWPA